MKVWVQLDGGKVLGVFAARNLAVEKLGEALSLTEHELEGFAEEHENLRPHHNGPLPPNPHVFRGADLDAYARGLMGSPTRRYGESDADFRSRILTRARL